MSELDGLKTNRERDVTFYVSHFARTEPGPMQNAMRYDAIWHEQFAVLYEERLEEPKRNYSMSELIPFAFERFQVVLHEPLFLRYAKRFIKALLLIDPTSILVVDKSSGKISGAWPTAKELRYRIRIDELGIFGMEDGCVTVR